MQQCVQSLGLTYVDPCRILQLLYSLLWRLPAAIGSLFAFSFQQLASLSSQPRHESLAAACAWSPARADCIDKLCVCILYLYRAAACTFRIDSIVGFS